MKKILLIISLLISFAVAAAKVEVEIKGMTCGMCIEAVTRELKNTDKALNISVSLDSKKARFEEVKGKKLSDSEIRAAIKRAGYEAVKVTRKHD